MPTPVLAMYHDQGLPVLKHTGFGEAVNITLGLPFIRTSVDHGTALGLGGRRQSRPRQPESGDHAGGRPQPAVELGQGITNRHELQVRVRALGLGGTPPSIH